MASPLWTTSQDSLNELRPDPGKLWLNHSNLNCAGCALNTTPPSSNGTECEERADFQYIMFTTVYSIVFILGLAGNLLALWYFISTKTATTPANIFMVNLATIDLIFVLTLPYKIVYHAQDNNWIFGEAMCKITGSLFFANLYGSTLFLTCICIDRYIAVVHPIKSLKLKKPVYRIVTSVVIWLILAAAIMYLTFRGPLTSTFENGNVACLENFSSESWKGRISGVSLFAAVIGFFIPLMVIIICYPLIARKLLVNTGPRRSSSMIKKKALRTILVVFVVFLICFVPYHVIQLIHTLRRINVFSSCTLIRFTYSARRVTMALTSLNSCLDPILYYFAAERFVWKPSCCGQQLRFPQFSQTISSLSKLTSGFRSNSTSKATDSSEDL
ncbi:lysophosphatidic acid receptor 6 isoform X1 [Microcaecilia unicolor]|uniref:Lysophosphatidic acid receptor 6-like isoform X1 n=1 Tax=Microcaecilia unicolor TaxID=1415580 RepID=A0A6P7WZD8_9AMPH|nr:lysophosphatidic acid receptor 6-like isoform X1 [Microcaecilia unicolor]